VKATEILHERGQNLWLDNITRTLLDETLEAFYDHGDVGEALPPDSGNADELLQLFANAGINSDDLAAQLQRDGATSFVSAWDDLIDRIKAQCASVA